MTRAALQTDHSWVPTACQEPRQVTEERAGGLQGNEQRRASASSRARTGHCRSVSPSQGRADVEQQASVPATEPAIETPGVPRGDAAPLAGWHRTGKLPGALWETQAPSGRQSTTWSHSRATPNVRTTRQIPEHSAKHLQRASGRQPNTPVTCSAEDLTPNVSKQQSPQTTRINRGCTETGGKLHPEIAQG